MAATRPYWKGFLKLSLVTCPVALYPASSQSEKTQFHQINRKTGNRLRQQMVDEVTGKVVDKETKGRGYEVAAGKYVEIEAKELEAIQIESTHTIDIETFVPQAEIDKRFYERPYYLVPDGKGGDDAYAVLRDAMKDKDRVALARIVFANREHIVAIEDWGKGMLCTTLRYDYEVRRETDVFTAVPATRVSKDMVDLAAHILDSKAGHFNPSLFKDQYELALRKLVKRKASGKVIERREPRGPTSNVIDLMSALRQSLKGGPAASRKAKTSPKQQPTAAPRTGRRRKSA
jgi:DNA end-binding protein Ku